MMHAAADVAGIQVEADAVISADGTIIGYRQMGRGEPLIVLHGSALASQHYVRLGQALASTYTVYIPDRRGRGLSGPHTPDHGMDKELADVAALMQATGAQLIFGHSAGAVIALEAALDLPLAKLVLYEPPLLECGLPIEWVPRFATALAHGRLAAATAMFLKGMRMNWLSALPLPVIRALAWPLLFGQRGQEMRELLPTIARDLQTARDCGPASRYAAVQARTLLLGGQRSPAYLQDALRLLAGTIPDASVHLFPKLEHTAPAMTAPETVADAARAFFRGGDSA